MENRRETHLLREWQCLVDRLASLQKFTDGGPQHVEMDWLRHCKLLQLYRSLQHATDTETLAISLAKLEPLTDDHFAQLGAAAHEMLGLRSTIDSGESRGDGSSSVEQISKLMQGCVAVVLAAETLRVEELDDRVSDQFARHATTALRCFSQARPLTDQRPRPERPAGSVELPVPSDALLKLTEEPRHLPEGINVSGWLTVENLLLWLREEAPPAIHEQQIKLLMVSRHRSKPEGMVCPCQLELLPASFCGLSGPFIDLTDSGLFAMDDEMLDSLRTAFQLRREQLSKASAERELPLAVRIRPEFRDPVMHFDGPSAGLLFDCGIRATVTQTRLNQHASATAAFAADKESGGIQPDAVADESILAKIAAARDFDPPIVDVVLDARQAQRFAGHPEVKGVKIKGVHSLDEAYAYLTSEAELERILQRHSDAVAGQWDRITSVPQNASSRESRRYTRLHNEHRPDKYVWPRYGILPAGKLPTDDTSRDTHAFEPGHEERPNNPYVDVEGTPEQQLLNLLEVHHSLCVTEDAGAGKTVFSLRAQSVAASAEGLARLFQGEAALIVRFEGAWPTDDEERPLPLHDALAQQLLASVPDEFPEKGSEGKFPEKIRETVNFALNNGRLLLILDAWDQFRGTRGTDSDDTDPRSQRGFIGRKILNADGPLARCRVIVTSRVYATKKYEQVFDATTWRFGMIRGFDEKQQEEYFAPDLTDRWHDMVPNRREIQDLLRVPDVLRMIRGLTEETPDDQTLPTFTRRGDLYLETSRRMLRRALNQEGIRVDADRFRQLRRIISTIAFQMMLDENYNYAVEGDAIDELLERAYQRHRQSFQDYDRLPDRQRGDIYQQWHACVDVLKKIELSHRSVVEAWTDETLSFRSRKMMEWYAGYYLANYATLPDLKPTEPVAHSHVDEKSAEDFTADDDWHWAWRFAIELPPNTKGRRERNDEVLGRSLALLFEKPKQGRCPTRLMYLCWHLFEVEPTPKIRDKFPYERDNNGNIRLLPGATDVIRNWRWQFWESFSGLDRNDQLEALWLFPERLILAMLDVDPVPESCRDLLGLSSAQLGQVRALCKPLRDELIRRWQAKRSRTYPHDPWPGETYFPQRAYQYCPPQAAPEKDATVTILGRSTPNSQRTFDQGSGDSDERPKHTVRVDSFLMQTFPVTQSQYRIFDNRYTDAHEGKDTPVTRITWYDSWIFSKFLGNGFRLPTESEYEFAARATSTTDYWYGDSFEAERSIIGDGRRKRPLTRSDTLDMRDQFINRFGLCHIVGNQDHWLWDWFDRDWYKQRGSQTDDDGGPAAGASRVVRGGSFNPNVTWYCRSSYRNHYDATFLDYDVGFRLVCCLACPESSSGPLDL